MKKFNKPRQVEVEWLREDADEEYEDDTDSADEDSIPNVPAQRGFSTGFIEILSWEEMEKEIKNGCRIVNENDAQEYADYFETKDLMDAGDEDEDSNDEDDDDEEDDEDSE